MTIKERMEIFSELFDDLTNTNSQLEKRQIIFSTVTDSLQDDFNYIIECLNGKHKFGYKYSNFISKSSNTLKNFDTIREILEFLQEPKINKDLSQNNIQEYVNDTYEYAWFVGPIVDRELKLGIGNSLLKKTNYEPMLAKRYEGALPYSKEGYAITEKLDGNRCIGRFENGVWIFTSRNGKIMNVNFDMSGLDVDYVYDGEVLSPEQTELSKQIFDAFKQREITGKMMILSNNDDISTTNFNSTSGIINRHTLDKKLIYNIFDIQDEELSYQHRRYLLNGMKPESKDVRILPVLTYQKDDENLQDYLTFVTSMGGEGIMINALNAKYEHKRTDKLLKFKKVQTMDMKVIGYFLGTGKYEGVIGSLRVEVRDNDKIYRCNVGSGLTDVQREYFVTHTNELIGKIVEVGYFSVCQDIQNKGTNVYSLRFPRILKFRYDKNETSIY